jgi:AraC family transcriptional regulator, arabinose operon regulatory protein
VVEGFYLTGAGYFPEAKYHYRRRAEGFKDNILIYSTAGRGWFEAQGVRQNVEPDSMFLLPAGLPHAYGAQDLKPWSIYWATYNGIHCKEYSRFLPDNQLAATVTSELKPELVRLFQALFVRLHEELSIGQLICASKMLEVIFALLFLRNRAFHGAVWVPQDIVSQIIHHMRQHLDRPLGLGEMARASKLSDSHLSHLFKQRTGDSPVHYFIRLRMQRACQYLTTTNYPIKRIALLLGYEDAGYFARIFRKVMRVAPARYRKN